ncbi:cation diffusion facilitator family transporter, partial [Acidithiobacillus sp. GGI-221]
ALLHEIGEELRAHFQIVHPTLQVETGDPGHPCKLAGEHLV